MSNPSGGSVLRQNWHLIGILVLVVAGIIGYTLLGGGEDSRGESSTTASNTTDEASRPPRYASEGRPSPADEATEIITEYETKIAENPEDEDTPALLYAAGNLYRSKLQDYEAAAKKYQVILLEHEDWEGIENVFPQLEVCFEKTGDSEGLTWLYEYMMEHMPEDSQHYLYAQQKMNS